MIDTAMAPSWAVIQRTTCMLPRCVAPEQLNAFSSLPRRQNVLGAEIASTLQFAGEASQSLLNSPQFDRDARIADGR